MTQILALKPKEFDIILDIKTRNVLYCDPISNKELEEIEIVQGDYKANQLNIHLEDGGQPYIIGENIVSIIFKLHDGTIISIDDDELIVEDSIIKAILPTNVLSIVGRQVYGEVVVWGKNGERLTSAANFEFWVKQGILTDEMIEGSNELPILSMLIEQVYSLEEDIIFSFTEIDGELKATITNANEINDILSDEETGTIKQADDINETLIDTIFEGGQVFEDVNSLKGLRIEVSETPPTDTLFWYDTSDTTEIERRVV